MQIIDKKRMEGRTKSSSRTLSVAQEAAEVSGRAYLPWWQKWDYNGVEIIRREREYEERREKMREKRWLKRKRWCWFICWRGRRRKKKRRRREEGKEEEGD